jgi:MFS family permease
MGLASSSGAAAVGAALTGLGYSLVFPGLGVEAVRRAPPESRGVAMGAYTACLDLALGVSGPALGLVAGKAGVSAVFLVSALIVLGAATIAVRLLRVGRPNACCRKMPMQHRGWVKSGPCLMRAEGPLPNLSGLTTVKPIELRTSDAALPR